MSDPETPAAIFIRKRKNCISPGNRDFFPCFDTNAYTGRKKCTNTICSHAYNVNINKVFVVGMCI